MSKEVHSPKHESGNADSYIIGFSLSLLFTAIPYYLVVNHRMSGNGLLAMILGIAVLQMIIQIVFFLHLGRGPKPLYNVVFFVFTAVTIMVVVLGSIFIMNNLHYNMSPAEVTTKLAEDEAIYQVGGSKTGACQEIHENHKVTITNGIVSPSYTKAHTCDTLTFINEDEPRELAFGAHAAHESYSGQGEFVVRKGRNKTITLNETGTYSFHDHLDPTVTGSFSVTE